MLKLGKLRVNELLLRENIITSDIQEELWGSGNTYTFSDNGTFITTQNEETYNIIIARGNQRNTTNDLSYSSYTNLEGEIIGSEIYGADYDLFQFLADNTDVEWGAFLNGGVSASGSSPCLLQTSHSHTSCKTYYNESVLSHYDTFMHSHPASGESGYSESDWNTWRDMYTNSNKTKKFGIYTVSDKRKTDYSSDVKYNRPEKRFWE